VNLESSNSPPASSQFKQVQSAPPPPRPEANAQRITLKYSEHEQNKNSSSPLKLNLRQKGASSAKILDRKNLQKAKEISSQKRSGRNNVFHGCWTLVDGFPTSQKCLATPAG
jgi:hypothetical protein